MRLSAAALLSVLCAGLPLLVLVEWASGGAAISNGELILLECANALLATAVVWIVAHVVYRNRGVLKLGWGALVFVWLLAAGIASVFAFAVTMPSFVSDTAIANTISRNYLADQLTDKRTYREELASLDLPAVAMTQNLGREDLAEAAARLAEASSVVARHSVNADKRAVAYRVAIKTSPISWGVKTALLMRIDRNAAAARVVRQRGWNDEAQLTQLVAQNVALMRDDPGRWVMRGDRIEWKQQDLQTAYDANVRAILRVVADERAQPAVWHD